MAFPISAGDLAVLCKAQLVGDPQVLAQRFSALKGARAGDLAFLSDAKYRADLRGVSGAIVILGAEHLPESSEATFLVVDSPRQVFARLARSAKPVSEFSGISSLAMIAPDAVLGENVEIGPYAVVGAEVTIGSGTVIHPFVHIGRGSVIGECC